MASTITYANSIVPYSGANIILNNVEIDATPPNSGEILVATGASTAHWELPSSSSNQPAFLLANASIPALPNSRRLFLTDGVVETVGGSTYEWALVSTFTPVSSINSALITATTKGLITTATTGTITENKETCRVATTTAGVLANAFENGDTIDGVVLATGDKILIKNQSLATENGLYVVQATGAPSRLPNLPTGANASGTLVSISEGTINANQVFICANPVSSGVVDTDNLTFRQLLGTRTTSIKVSSSQELINAINDGYTTILMGPSEYNITQSLAISAGTTIKGYGLAPTISFTSSSGSLFTLSGGDNITIENIKFYTPVSSITTILTATTNNINIKECYFIGGGANQPKFINLTGSSNVKIDSCFFTITGNSSTNNFISLDAVDSVNISNCVLGANVNNEVLITNGSSNVNLFGLQISDVSIYINNSTNIVIDSCYLSNSSLIDVSNSSTNISICNNAMNSAPSGETIINLDTTDFVKITGNTIGQGTGNNLIDGITATNTTIRGNTFFGGLTGTIINLQSNCNHSLVDLNSFRLNTGQDIVVSSTGNDLTGVLYGCGLIILTDPTNISAYYNTTFIDKNSDPLPAITLNDPTLGSANRTIYIRFLVNSAGTATFDINYTGTSFTTITYSAIGQYVVLQWNGVSWDTLTSSGVVFS